MKILTILLFTLSHSLFAVNVGFENGNEYEARDLSGSFTLFCPQQTRVVHCRGYELAPASFDYLLFPTTVVADQVELSSVNESGKVTKKKLKVISNEGRSKKRVNLWVKTLFQKPLLSLGKNKILYQFSYRGNDSLAGSFSVDVKAAAPLQCRHETMIGSQRDCENAYPLCSVYFAQQNNCQ